MLGSPQLLLTHTDDLDEVDDPKGRGDGQELGVLGHQHVLDPRLTAIQGHVPGDVVTTVQDVLCVTVKTGSQ